MIQPLLQDAAFIADVRRAQQDLTRFHLWWLGQSGFLLQWQNRHLLFDPYLSDSLTAKYANTDKPHVRMTARVVDPVCLDFIDVVTSSHNHTDHLDAETLGPLLKSNPKLEIVIPEANRTFVTDRLGIITDLPVGLDAGQSAKVAGFTIHGVPAAHETIDRDSYGRCKYLGYVVQFGPWTVYHSGDTVLYDGMVELLRQWPIDLALLPINGRAPERRVAGNLSGREAATLAKEIGARCVIPCHFEMFEFNTASPDEFIRAAVSLEQPHRVLKCGERWSSEARE
ncbi:MAG: MBL fold metallo-hydrolase [Verrucomicrobiota bacterium]|jgi:L-ascorbate metabolism protein UlaG (beta-lactamase superfamily)